MVPIQFSQSMVGSYSFFLFELSLGILQLTSQGRLHEVKGLDGFLQFLHVTDQVRVLLDQLGTLIDTILHLTM